MINVDDFQPLFAEEALGQVRMIPHRWTLLIDIIRLSVSFEDPDFPLEFFITEMQQLSLSPKVTKFLADLLLRIPNVANKNNLRETTADPTADRKARVTISVNLPQYDGLKGHAAKFVAKFTHLATTQKFPESEWDSLLMDSLKKEALKHFESSRRKFTSHNSYFKTSLNSSTTDQSWMRGSGTEIPSDKTTKNQFTHFTFNFCKLWSISNFGPFSS